MTHFYLCSVEVLCNAQIILIYFSNKTEGKENI